jgi:predicted RNase H-like nuclease (RuvC/YqgF family)
MSTNYFPGIGLLKYLTSEGIECEEPSPEPEPEPAPEPERDPTVIYAEPIGENREIIDLKQKIKILEEKVKYLTHENNNLKMRLELENSIEKIYEKLPSLQSIEETLQNITHNIGR